MLSKFWNSNWGSLFSGSKSNAQSLNQNSQTMEHKVLKLGPNQMTIESVYGEDLNEAFNDICFLVSGSNNLGLSSYFRKRLSPELLLYYARVQTGIYNPIASRLVETDVYGDAIVVYGFQRELTKFVLNDMCVDLWTGFIDGWRIRKAKSRLQPVPETKGRLSKLRTNTSNDPCNEQSDNNSNTNNGSTFPPPHRPSKIDNEALVSSNTTYEGKDLHEKKKKKKQALPTLTSRYAIETVVGSLLLKGDQIAKPQTKTDHKKNKRRQYFDVDENAGTVIIENENGYKTRKSKRLATKKKK